MSLWTTIFSFISGSNSNEILFKLLTHCLEYLSSDDIALRFQSLNFLKAHILRLNDIESDSENEIIPQLMELLQERLHTCLYEQQVEQELCSIVNLLCILFADTPDFFKDYQYAFMEAAIEACTDDSLNIDTRIHVHNIMEAGAFTVATQFADSLEEIITNSIAISLESCEIDRESTQYQFPLSFFFALSTAFDSNNEDVFEIFFSAAKELIESEDPSALQVSLLVLQSIIEGEQEIVTERIDDFLELVLTAGSADDEDEILIIQCCETIKELTNYVPDALNVHIDEIASYLIQRSNENEAVATLDNLFYRLERPPNFIDDIATVLTSTFDEASSYRIELVLSCLTSAFSHVEQVDESVFEALSPILSSILAERDDLHGPVLECYARLAQVSPISIQTSIDEIINATIDCFSFDNPPLTYLCICLEQLSIVLPTTLSEYVPSVVPPLFAVFQDESNEKTSACALRCLAKFLGQMPEAMADYADRIVDYLLKRPFESDVYMIPACEGIAYAADGMKSLGMDVSVFITEFLPAIKAKDDKDLIAAILMICGEIYSSLGQLDEEIFQLSVETLMPALCGEYQNMMKSDISSVLDPVLQRPLFYCMMQFIQSAGELCESIVDQTFEALSPNLESSCSSLLRCYTVLLFSKICAVLSINSELHTISLTNAMSFMNETSIELKKITIKAFLNLLKASPEELNSVSSEIIEYVQPIIDEAAAEQFNSPSLTNAAVALFTSLIRTFEVEVSVDLISTLLELLPPPVDSDEIVDAACFAVYVHEKYPQNVELVPQIAANLLASSQWYVQQVPQEVFEVLVSYLSGLEEDEVSALVKHNQKQMSRILSSLT